MGFDPPTEKLLPMEIDVKRIAGGLFGDLVVDLGKQ